MCLCASQTAGVYMTVKKSVCQPLRQVTKQERECVYIAKRGEQDKHMSTHTKLNTIVINLTYKYAIIPLQYGIPKWSDQGHEREVLLAALHKFFDVNVIPEIIGHRFHT